MIFCTRFTPYQMPKPTLACLQCTMTFCHDLECPDNSIRTKAKTSSQNWFTNYAYLLALSARCDLHQSAKDFVISFVNSASFKIESRNCLRRTPIAFGSRSSWHCWLPMNVGQHRKTAFTFFSCFSNRLVTLFSAMYAGKYCTRRSVDRYRNFPAFSNC